MSENEVRPQVVSESDVKMVGPGHDEPPGGEVGHQGGPELWRRRVRVGVEHQGCTAADRGRPAPARSAARGEPRQREDVDRFLGHM